MNVHLKTVMGTAFLSIFTLLTSPVFASEASLSWNANSEADLNGYRIHYGTSSGVYLNSIDVGNQTAYIVTGLGPGTYYFSVTAYDDSGNGSGFSNEVIKTISGPLDTTPPVISNINVANVTSVSASISWTTDEPASNQVEYGTSTGYGMTTSYNPSLSTSHSVVINNLSPSTIYHFRLINSDESGNMALSPDQSFTTEMDSDTTPPGDVENFSLSPDNQSITLSWTNPPDSDYKGVRIRFKTDGFPQNINDGILLGDFPGSPGGTGSYTHTGLNNNLTYFYSASSFDQSGNFQSTVYAAVSPLGPGISGSGDSDSSVSGGCGMINPTMGPPPGPGQAADMVGLLILLAVGLIRKTLKNLSHSVWAFLSLNFSFYLSFLNTLLRRTALMAGKIRKKGTWTPDRPVQTPSYGIFPDRFVLNYLNPHQNFGPNPAFVWPVSDRI